MNKSECLEFNTAGYFQISLISSTFILSCSSISIAGDFLVNRPVQFPDEFDSFAVERKGDFRVLILGSLSAQLIDINGKFDCKQPITIASQRLHIGRMGVMRLDTLSNGGSSMNSSLLDVHTLDIEGNLYANFVAISSNCQTLLLRKYGYFRMSSGGSEFSCQTVNIFGSLRIEDALTVRGGRWFVNNNKAKITLDAAFSGVTSKLYFDEFTCTSKSIVYLGRFQIRTPELKLGGNITGEICDSLTTDRILIGPKGNVKWTSVGEFTIDSNGLGGSLEVLDVNGSLTIDGAVGNCSTLRLKHLTISQGAVVSIEHLENIDWQSIHMNTIYDKLRISTCDVISVVSTDIVGDMEVVNGNNKGQGFKWIGERIYIRDNSSLSLLCNSDNEMVSMNLIYSYILIKLTYDM